MTEMVLLFPIFLLFLLGFSKLFALLVLVQKTEIASYYAARRWQLESHRNVRYEGWDDGTLRRDIQNKVSDYLGWNRESVKKFLDLKGIQLTAKRMMVWQKITLTVKTNPWQIPGLTQKEGLTWEVEKYVPNRDRPISFILPGATEQ
ncbi:MAG: hypothetical protein A3G41_07720 [Elusimicrobia bacterium RIFCSPLOWO2_12_FULL_59_9]|nr:MAG: hypothetical protein A3G41_07720 [Elusimicrobia bacterium RIFCSPLOWO2_12_FULL_59_9]